MIREAEEHRADDQGGHPVPQTVLGSAGGAGAPLTLDRLRSQTSWRQRSAVNRDSATSGWSGTTSVGPRSQTRTQSSRSVRNAGAVRPGFGFIARQYETFRLGESALALRVGSCAPGPLPPRPTAADPAGAPRSDVSRPGYPLPRTSVRPAEDHRLGLPVGAGARSPSDGMETALARVTSRWQRDRWYPTPRDGSARR